MATTARTVITDRYSLLSLISLFSLSEHHMFIARRSSMLFNTTLVWRILFTAVFVSIETSLGNAGERKGRAGVIACVVLGRIVRTSVTKI